ncbi:MAG: hypothetical protein A2039_06395 [Candidatus Melainabacteria bacterium GWA2_34_9]|nr:MAG: hypothetical protein A2039_06395 [Candidatus Melainabacteria bacterium GWA2_34_9]
MTKESFLENRIKDSGNFPKVVLLDTVNYCNLRCSMCFHGKMKREKGYMPWDLFTKIIDEIAEKDKNTRVWMVFFGEPFMMGRKNPSIFDFIKYAKSKGMTDVVLNSNATIMDEEMAQKTIESGLDAIYIGIDSFSTETYSKTRVGGDYDRTVKNIEYLLKLKSELNTDSPKVFVQFVEMDINRAEKEDFIKFWQEKGAIVKIRPMVSWAGKVNAPNLILDNENRWPCHWAMQTMSIVNTGDVVTCAVDLDASFVAGNIKENTLEEVWNSKLKTLRQMHIDHEFSKLPDNCKNCKDWQAASSEYVEVQTKKQKICAE